MIVRFRRGNMTETRPVHGKLDHHVSAGRKRDGYKQLPVSVEFTKYGNTLFRPVHHEKFPNIPVSLVSELHNYSTRSASSNQVAIPLFRTNLRRFCPSIIGSFFWNDIPQSIRDKPSKKMFKKALLRWYLAQY